MLIGSHVSIRNGYLAAAQFTHKINANAFQYFPKNPRSLTVKSFDAKDAEHCARFCEQHSIYSIAHAPYPVNLSEADPHLRKVIKDSLINDLEITNACGSIGLVVHFGKFKGADPLEGYKLMIDMLNDILLNWKGTSLILIENNAGQGVRMGTTFEELVQVRKLTDYPDKIGFCLDTCHAFASGLWEGSNWAEVMEKGMELDYFSHLKAIHLNDSVYGCRSYRDRHANIGRGQIGEVNMKELLQSKAVQGLPWVLETPELSGYTHGEEIRYVRGLVSL